MVEEKVDEMGEEEEEEMGVEGERKDDYGCQDFASVRWLSLQFCCHFCSCVAGV